jgi:hypothetical protein
MNEKGQISTIDLTIAFIIMIAILLSVMEVWNTIITHINQFYHKRTIHRKALDAAEMLVNTPGMPYDWQNLGEVNSSTVDSIGFAARDNVLDYLKLEKTSSIDYGELKKILGLNKEEARITVIDVMNSSRPVLFEYGLPANGTSVVAGRYGLLNGSIVEARVELYYSGESFMTT